ncbi:NADH dehydrogenase [ubiquinone] 1 alpha subcomplex subunit 11 [Epargyreus clarus]|uniref:NADH dehydrogenase [ubiquinone] 1 alpha subcomplex subunit 11 n=1 Tax=Epargyreus clarus TaxID=520877 RepID=UPI003C30DF00
MLSYKYYDTPDGQDVYKKTFVLSKYAALSGTAVGTMDILLFSHPKGLFNTAHRFMWYVGPLVGMATAFTLTSSAAQNFRGKDDKLNYFLGGVASGTVFGAWARSPVVAVPMCLVLGAVAVVKKTAVEEGWVMFPKFEMMKETIQSVRNDWTLVKDIDELKTWTKGN